MRSELQSWFRFIRAESHIFRDYPSLVFQQAANSVKGTGPAIAASRLLERGHKHATPWLRWLTKDQNKSSAALVLRHQSTVFHCSFSNTAEFVVTCCHEALRLWSTQTGEELTSFPNNESWNSSAISPDASRIVGSTRAASLVVLDLKTGEQVTEIKEAASYNVQWLDQFRVIATISDRVIEWDTRRTDWSLLSKEEDGETIHDCSVSVNYGDTDLEKHCVFLRHLIPWLKPDGGKEPIDLAAVQLTHYSLQDLGKRRLKLGDEDEEAKLKPLTEIGGGEPRDREQAYLSELITRMNSPFEGELTDADLLNYAHHIRDKMLESEVLAQQAANNSKEQFALGDIDTVMMDAVIEGLDNYRSMASQVLRNENVKRGFAELLLGLVYDSFRKRATTN